MAKKLLTNKRKAFVPVSTLQKTALVMLHFYHAIAKQPKYAEVWSKAVATADLNKMQALLGMITTQAKRLPLGSNGIGYFIHFLVLGQSLI
ncbi:hypothetical protein M3231_02510 [Neobacillus mesonae]|nr:hypothetical protein [Neobacillus mesonae]